MNDRTRSDTASRNMVALILTVGIVAVVLGSLVTLAFIGTDTGEATETEEALLGLVTNVTMGALGAVVGYLAGRNANGGSLL